MHFNSNRDGFCHPFSSEITPQPVYEGRRDLIKLMASGVAGAALASWASREAFAQGANGVPRPGKLAALPGVKSSQAGALTLDKLTDYKDASSYNNFYEFGTDKSDPAKNAHTRKQPPGRSKSKAWLKSPPSTRSKTCSNSVPRKSGYIACAVWKAGRWLFLGS